MKKIFLISVLLLSILLSCDSFVFAQEPSEFWMRMLVTRLGFYSGDLNSLTVEQLNNLSDSDFALIKELDTPTYIYFDLTGEKIPSPTVFDTITEIPVGEYYVVAYVTHAGFYNGDEWEDDVINVWMSMYFTFKGFLELDDGIVNLTGNFVPVTIESNEGAALDQTLTGVSYNSTIDFTFTVESN